MRLAKLSLIFRWISFNFANYEGHLRFSSLASEIMIAYYDFLVNLQKEYGFETWRLPSKLKVRTREIFKNVTYVVLNEVHRRKPQNF